jgi:MGT family glycosyltransferase
MNIAGQNLVSAVVGDIAELNIVFVTELLQPCLDKFDERFVFTIPKIESTHKIDIDIPYGKMKSPVIYISMGSMIKNRIFLKKCIKAFGNKDLSVIMSCGGMQPEKIGHLPSNIYAYPFVPQLDVLQHADLFITHGGMNSVNEAMFFGVPMLVRPIMNDQPINAIMVENIGIGKQLSLIRSSKQIYMKAMDVLNDARIKERAEEVKQKVHSDIGVPGVVDRIEKLLEIIEMK